MEWATSADHIKPGRSTAGYKYFQDQSVELNFGLEETHDSRHALV